MRKPFICGNWKMNKTWNEAVDFLGDFLPRLQGVDGGKVQVGIGAPFISLERMATTAKGSILEIGAENCFWEEKGAFTGEIAPNMIKAAGSTFVIIGHSERRQYFGETNETINKKLAALLKHGLVGVVCIGETLAQREADQAEAVVKDHLTGSLKGIAAEDLKNVVLAYEPVWAIGTGKTASPAQAQEIHAFARKTLSDLYGAAIADATRILYGGSMNPANVKELMACPDVDGGLIGGAALKPDDFEKLVKFNQ
ncbi:MAG: triose-phosphate isomerase [Planctomycetota bacterium]|jgi:triosephosphate isomerase|nr:triose-phosphate isomerase [Planctomycetota bacterium]